MPVANALIGLGANLGDRSATLDAAVELLRNSPEVELFRVSPWLETDPAGGPANQPAYLNGAAWFKTQLSPEALFTRLQEIETALGRERTVVWGPRTLDLDLLLYDDIVLNLSQLQVPHRWLPFRGFVLDPAVVIAPDWIHPNLQKSIYDLRVQLRAIPYWFVIGGGTLAARKSLATELAARFEGFQLAPFDDGVQVAGELPLRELPPSGIFISSVDWTQHDAEIEQGLQLHMPVRNTTPATTWRLDPGAKAWPLPKARIQLCVTEPEYLTTDITNRLTSLYQSLSPLPTLNILATTSEQIIEQAVTMIAALTGEL